MISISLGDMHNLGFLDMIVWIGRAGVRRYKALAGAAHDETMVFLSA
jgi:hypothetical protein